MIREVVKSSSPPVGIINEGALGNAVKGVLGNIMNFLQNSVDSLKRGAQLGASKKIGGDKEDPKQKDVDPKTEKDLVTAGTQAFAQIEGISEKFDTSVTGVLKATKSVFYTSKTDTFENVAADVAKQIDQSLAGQFETWTTKGTTAGLSPSLAMAAVFSAILRAIGNRV